MLDELDQDAPGALRVEEGDPMAPGAGPGRLVDRIQAFGPKAGEGAIDVGDPERHVVDAGPTALEEAADGGVPGSGLEELEAADEGDVHALALQLLDRGTSGPGEEFEERSGVAQRRDGHAHVIDRI